MFGKSNQKQIEERLEKAETALKNSQELNRKLVDAFAECAFLVAIDVRGKSNIFKLQRDGEIFYIETYHMMQDEVTLWKTQAGIE
jgi:DNA-binding protein YbaB